jgi:ABC-2 type transport system ATP-binding protein
MSGKKIGKRIEMHTDGDVAISVKDLHKSFNLPTEKSWGLKQAIFNRLKGKKGYVEQKVLKGLDFEIKKGEFVGIVGRNGSGKSTLLKILAGVYYPAKGRVTIDGNLVPFIELGVGFNPELTGRENVYMNGALLGFSNQEMDEMYDDIWKFAELEKFQDQKLKNYSSGMQVRLAFSIAIRAKGDILILDEVLAVGDAAFQQKCNDYFASLRDKKQTVVLVTHSMENVTKYCTRAMLLEQGKIIKDGDPKEVATAYIDLWRKNNS